MLLILSASRSTNATYRNAATGLVHYKVTTPIRVHQLTTTILRRLDDTELAAVSPGVSRELEGEAAWNEAGGRRAAPSDERFAFLASVSFKLIGWQTTINFRGQEFKPAGYLRSKKGGMLDWGYTFTAADGKDYHWSVSQWSTKLAVDDETHAPVAEYLVKSLGVISERKDATIEIFPAFEYMADEIMLTFICVEKYRRSQVDKHERL